MRISDQEYNQLLVLKTIRRLEPIARTALASATGLAGGTITKLIGQLVDRHMVIEERVAKKAKGRPKVHLRINPAAGHVIGAWISFDGRLAVEIVDFQGQRLYTDALNIRKTRSMRALAREVARLINVVIAASSLSKTAIARVGITLPGMVDNRRGKLLWLATFPTGPAPFAEVVEQQIDLPVVIDSSANVMARAEHWFGSDAQLDNFLLLNLDFGVGSAYYKEGVLWAGASGVNPELGHVKVAIDSDLPCYCGARGCLASFVSMSGIARQWARLRGVDDAEALTLDTIQSDFDRSVELAAAGNPEASAIFERAGRLLGVAIANQINARDPGRVIIASIDARLLALLEPTFFAVVEVLTFPPLRGTTRIEFRPITEEVLWQGAASLGLERAYLG